MWNDGNINITEIIPGIQKIIDANIGNMRLDGNEIIINNFYGDIEDILGSIARIAGSKIISGYIWYHGDHDGCFFWDDVDKVFHKYTTNEAMEFVATWHDERVVYLDRYRKTIREYFSSNGCEDKIAKYYVLREMEFVLSYAFNISTDECKKIYGEEYANMYFGKENV